MPGAETADQRVLETGWAGSAKDLLERGGVPDVLRFDAVFIDEAQDFSPAWFELIQCLGASEVVLAYDSAQRLYERQEALTRGDIARLFGGKTGRMRRLGKAIRLPAASIETATTFAARWSVQTLPLEAAEDGLLPPDAAVSTISATTPAESAAIVLSVLRAWMAEPDYRAREVAVVVPEKAIGEALVRLLAEHGISTNHVFGVSRTGALMEAPVAGMSEPAWRTSQAHKTAFALGDARLKVSTVHSFKGWDAGRVIFILPFTPAIKQMASMVYVGLTRSRGELVLIGHIGDYRLEHIQGARAAAADVDPLIAARFEDLQSWHEIASLQSAASARRPRAAAPRQP